MRNYWVILFAVGLAGCATTSRGPIAGGAAPLPQETTTPYFIAPLDRATVQLKDGTREVVEVTNEGTLELVSGSKWVKGMPVAEFRQLIQKQYPGAKRIEIEEFRTNRVTVLGEVFHQINTDLTDGPMRVMDAVAAANGFTSLANKRRVRLLRQNAGTIQVYELDLRQMMVGNDLAQNLLLQPGDVITVPRNFL